MEKQSIFVEKYLKLPEWTIKLDKLLKKNGYVLTGPRRKRNKNS